MKQCARDLKRVMTQARAVFRNSANSSSSDGTFLATPEASRPSMSGAAIQRGYLDVQCQFWYGFETLRQGALCTEFSRSMRRSTSNPWRCMFEVVRGKVRKGLVSGNHPF